MENSSFQHAKVWYSWTSWSIWLTCEKVLYHVNTYLILCPKSKLLLVLIVLLRSLMNVNKFSSIRLLKKTFFSCILGFRKQKENEWLFWAGGFLNLFICMSAFLHYFLSLFVLWIYWSPERCIYWQNVHALLMKVFSLAVVQLDC